MQIASSLNPHSASYKEAYNAQQKSVAELNELHSQVRLGGGAKAVARQHEMGKLTARERVQRSQGDYLGELRRHIADGNPPPPPPYPQGLIT